MYSPAWHERMPSSLRLPPVHAALPQGTTVSPPHECSRRIWQIATWRCAQLRSWGLYRGAPGRQLRPDVTPTGVYCCKSQSNHVTKRWCTNNNLISLLRYLLGIFIFFANFHGYYNQDHLGDTKSTDLVEEQEVEVQAVCDKGFNGNVDARSGAQSNYFCQSRWFL